MCTLIFNTKKELFLGTRKFTSKKMTKDQFMDKLDKYLQARGINDFMFNFSCDEIEDIEEENQYIYDEQIGYCVNNDEYRIKLYKFFNQLLEVVTDDGDYNKLIGDYQYNYFDCNHEFELDISNHCELFETSNGFVYAAFCNDGDDETFTYSWFILYFDENDDLRAYIPYYGNIVNVDSKGHLECSACTDDFFEPLIKKHKDYITTSDGIIAELQAYGLEYGVEGDFTDIIAAVKKTGNYGNLYFAIEEDFDKIQEDIESNVVLMD